MKVEVTSNADSEKKNIEPKKEDETKENVKGDVSLKNTRTRSKVNDSGDKMHVVTRPIPIGPALNFYREISEEETDPREAKNNFKEESDEEGYHRENEAKKDSRLDMIKAETGNEMTNSKLKSKTNLEFKNCTPI